MKRNSPRSVADAPIVDFEIFLTDRCNQSCSYCYTRHMRDGTGNQTLTFDQLKRFADLFTGDERVQKAGPVKVEFSGGEPLLEFELLKKTIDYIRANKLAFDIAVATNGTLLTKSRIDYFVRNNVDMRISLDGMKAINDPNRRFAQGQGRSVFDIVTANIKKGFSTARHMDRCSILPTLTPGTIDALPEIVDFFRHEVGVTKLPIGLEAYAAWDQDAIDRFRKALRRMVSGFLTALKPGADDKRSNAAFAEFPIRRELKSEDEGKVYTAGPIALHYDGYFYPSPDFVVAPPPLDPKYRVGDPSSGVDVKKLKAVLSPMLAKISRKCEHWSGPRNPVEGYYWGIVNKVPADRIDRLLESTSRINRVFKEETRDYLRLFEIYKRLSLATPRFGDFTHRPKYRSPREMRTLRLSLRKDPDIGNLREGLDYFLYSPGRRKELVLDAADTGAEDTISAAEGMALYAMMKAGYLEKKLGLTARCRASALDAERRSFFNEHGIRLEDHSAGSPGNE